MEGALRERGICGCYAAQDETKLVSVFPSKRPRIVNLVGSGAVHKATQDQARLRSPPVASVKPQDRTPHLSLNKQNLLATLSITFQRKWIRLQKDWAPAGSCCLFLHWPK